MDQPELSRLPVDELLDRLASGDPTPGGGAAAALAGALAASLVCMACHLTLGRERFADVESQVREILGRAEALRARLTEGVTADAAAYAAVIAARGLPKADQAEQTRRREAIERATRKAASVPLGVGESCASLLDLCESAVRTTNPHTLSDVAVAALLAGAGVQGAVANVEVNLAAIRDDAWVDSARTRVASIAADPERASRVAQQARERM